MARAACWSKGLVEDTACAWADIEPRMPIRTRLQNWVTFRLGFESCNFFSCLLLSWMGFLLWGCSSARDADGVAGWVFGVAELVLSGVVDHAELQALLFGGDFEGGDLGD